MSVEPQTVESTAGAPAHGRAGVLVTAGLAAAGIAGVVVMMVTQPSDGADATITALFDPAGVDRQGTLLDSVGSTVDRVNDDGWIVTLDEGDLATITAEMLDPADYTSVAEVWASALVADATDASAETRDGMGLSEDMPAVATIECVAPETSPLEADAEASVLAADCARVAVAAFEPYADLYGPTLPVSIDAWTTLRTDSSQALDFELGVPTVDRDAAPLRVIDPVRTSDLYLYADLADLAAR
ncbi:hypothetical protein [Demequina mangrovi]|uniref:Uncharacterized protein n=1 Tax=Demequina mangrovi TaxID=1043493 RepID=A0A1H6UNQ0_9MICO|nr:hypothetical protein [Demequina mangrovi]SEI94013.1 hypothetical protein SAMN05421637_0476 [Demequina mangrovi]